MQNKKIRPLRAKIAITIIIIVMASLLCLGAIFLISSRSISARLEESNSQMAETSKARSSTSMNEQTSLRLKELADNKATIADRTFYEFREAVEMIASAAEKLYSDEGSYPQRTVYPPDAANDGKLSLQVLYSSAADPENEATVREAGLLGNLQELLYTINLHNESIASTYFASASGIMVQADYISASKFDAEGKIMPLDADTRPWYQGAAASGKTFLTSVTKDAHTPRMAIMCGVPVYHEGVLMGVAGAGMYLDDIEDLMESVDIGKTGNFCIVNDYGRILFSSYETGMLSVAENDTDLRLHGDPAIVGLAINALNGMRGIERVRIDGTLCYVAFAPMKTVGWSVFVILSQEEVEAPTAALQEDLSAISAQAQEDARQQSGKVTTWFILMAAAALLIALAVSFLLSKRIVDPIQKLTDSVSQLKGEDLDFKWDLDTGDETQLLADSFQSLTQRMKTYISDIQSITAEKERIGAELSLAKRIQTDMLPGIFPAFPSRDDFDIFASMTPAKEVGGDFYDFFLVDEDHLALVIADVSGKGVPAALFMMGSMIRIKNCVEDGLSPAEALEKVNDQICSNNKEDMFVTVWLGILDLKTRKLTAANAGHEYPMLMQPGGGFELIRDPHGFVVGGMPEGEYREYEWQLTPGSKIFVYTDGIPEAGTDRKNQFGTARLIDALNAVKDKAPETILSAVHEAVNSFVGNDSQFDDLTMLCVEYKGQQA